MEYHVAVLSSDTIFARMLELEFSMLGLQVLSASSMDDSDTAEVTVLDLDSVDPPSNSHGIVIGFTRNSALVKIDTHRHCSMILHRPFEVRLLRREVLSALGAMEESPFSHQEKRAEEKGPEEKSISLTLNEEKSVLIIGDQSVSLTPIEARMMSILLEHRGQTVSREHFCALIGESSANKVEVYICYLRRKTDQPNGLRLIRTIRGKGYMIN